MIVAQQQALDSIQRAKVEQRIADQRAGFAAIANAVERAGLRKAARAIRKEAEFAIVRMEEMAAEYSEFQAEREAFMKLKQASE